MTDRDDTDPYLGHDLDRDFLAWVRNPDTLDADLRAQHYELALSAYCPLWRLVAIERELKRRGKDLLPAPVHVLQPSKP